jgi:hypothetical protein
MRDYLSRIAGALLLISAFVLLLLAPPKGQFSVLNFFAFLTCLVLGYLVAAGYVGTHPIAARLRREARLAGSFRPVPLCSIPSETFPITKHSKDRILIISLCAILGLLLLVSGTLVSRAFATRGWLVALPLYLAAALCFWCPLRQWSMYVRVDPQGITARSYFRTLSVKWEDVVALIAREHHIFLPGAHSVGTIGQLGTIYSIYSRKTKIDFTQHVPGVDRLISILGAATGLEWQ